MVLTAAARYGDMTRSDPASFVLFSTLNRYFSLLAQCSRESLLKGVSSGKSMRHNILDGTTEHLYIVMGYFG